MTVAQLLSAASVWLCPSGDEPPRGSDPGIPCPVDALPTLTGGMRRVVDGHLAVGIGQHDTVLLIAGDVSPDDHRLDDIEVWLDVAWSMARSRQQRQEAEERYQALLAANFEGVCLHENGLLIEVNQALADLYGYTREEMLGMHVSRLAAPEILPRIKAIVASGYDGAYETVALRHDGRRLPLEARGKAATFRGQPVRVAAFRDLREQKRAEEALIKAREEAEEASRVKTRFLGNMSHELRTPLAGIIGLSRLVMQTDLDASQREHITVLNQAAEGLLQLLGDLLDVTRIEENRLVLNPAPFSLAELVDRTAQIILPEVTRRQLALKVHIDPTLPAIWIGDGQRIQQVLLNLLSNAAKFTPSGLISLEVTPTDEGLRMEVSDTGIGMTAEQLSRVFERFFQADATQTRRYAGSGLGLHITHGLVLHMGGRITAQSRPQGGSIFTVHLPLTSGAPTPPAPPPPLRTFTPLTILLAEDHPINQLVIQRTLENMGHTVTLVDNGAAAVEACQSGTFDLVLMDIQMPVLDGIAATRLLRQRQAQPPIVALTARAMKGDREACLAAGMADYLEKPISPASFQQLLIRLNPGRS